jgi:hypothetical protein
MQTNQLLALRLREVFLVGKWIANTNYQEQVNNINWQQATGQIQDLNSIALLIFHINYYLEGLSKVFNGGPLDINDKFSFNMDPMQNEQDWQKLKNNFLNNATIFCNQVEQMSQNQLDEVFVDKKYGTYLRNIEAVIEHSYYHLGQIVLIKKMILKQS